MNPLKNCRPFLDENFLLNSETAEYLYHNHAEKLPIIDYHCHLSPKAIAEDLPFGSITSLWLGGDHYKWRAMRANGVKERFITGDASDEEKFTEWARTVPFTFRNPLYHWTHMELRSAFGISDLLNEKSASDIYNRCNERLKEPDMTPRGLMRKFNVEVVCTTDDPVDSLEYHAAIAESGFEIKVLPTWRPDKLLAFGKTESYLAYLAQLGEAADIEITGYASLLEAVGKRHRFFHDHGCRLADHGLGRIPYSGCSDSEAAVLFSKVMAGGRLCDEETEKLQSRILIDLMTLNNEKGWAQQIHFGPLRNVNTRMWEKLGPDTGFDTISDYRGAENLVNLLNELDKENNLAKTVLYNINPADNEWVAAMTGNFQDGSVPCKLQFGSAWWFNDHIRGMENQMNALSVQSLLSRFVGMLTDSRSFLSYPRHDYFRRILCNLLGNDVENGLIPVEEIQRVGKMAEDISYYNAKGYFKF